MSLQNHRALRAAYDVEMLDEFLPLIEGERYIEALDLAMDISNKLALQNDDLAAVSHFTQELFARIGDCLDNSNYGERSQ